MMSGGPAAHPIPMNPRNLRRSSVACWSVSRVDWIRPGSGPRTFITTWSSPSDARAYMKFFKDLLAAGPPPDIQVSALRRIAGSQTI